MESGFGWTDEGSAREIVTVSALNRAVAGLLSKSFALVRVRGEIGNFSRPASGHWYFTLKDSAAQVRCAMFRNRNVLADFDPREGDEVEVLAQVGLYEARGEYQLAVEALRRSGLGRLYERFLQLKSRLAAEGLFDEARKRALPRLPRAIGIVTSLQAAALRDVLSALARRSPQVALVVYPVPVQGEGAGAKIAAMLQQVSRRAEVDLVLLVRGGGSIEDLWAFNEEAVARAIRACAAPVVVGVGHESDFTIADFAADLRAPTPTAAAELAAPDRMALLQRVADQTAQLGRAVRGRFQQVQQRLDYGLRALAGPRAPLPMLAARLAQLRLRAAHAMRRSMDASLRTVADRCGRLGRRATTIDSRQHALRARCTALQVAAQRHLQTRRHDLQTLAARLQGLDPVAVLQRGYAIAADAHGRTVSDAGSLVAGDVLSIRFARGGAKAAILSTEPAASE